MAKFTLIYRDSTGNKLATITDFFSLEYVRRENQYGYLYLDLPATYPRDFFQIDNRIEVWRTNGIGMTYLDMDAVWFIVLVRTKTDESGNKLIHIVAHDGISLLDRRVIPYGNDTNYANKSLPADNFIRQVIRENFGSSATDATRNIGSAFQISEDAATSICPTVTMKKFGNRKILPLIQDIATASIKNGVYLSFDVVYNGIDSVAFNVYTGSRGANRGMDSPAPYLFSFERGNINYASLTLDYSQSFNVIYAGDVDGIVLTTVTDLSKISPYARREDFINVDKNDNTTWQPEVDSRLQETIPIRAVNSHVQQNYDNMYGVHYGYGDIVVVNYNDTPVDVHLDTVSIKADQQQNEQISIMARNYDEGS